MLNEKVLAKLSSERIQELIEKKKDLKKFKTVKLLEQELAKRKESKGETKKKRKKAGSLLSKEHLLAEEKERNIQKKQKRKENKDETQKSKLTREMKVYIGQVITEMRSEIITAMEETVKKEIEKLKRDGLFYGCKYLTLTLDQVAHKGIKNLGEKGWVYSFINGDKVTFMKMSGGKNEQE